MIFSFPAFFFWKINPIILFIYERINVKKLTSISFAILTITGNDLSEKWRDQSSTPSFSRNCATVMHFGIRKILWRFLSENISQFRNVAITQDRFMIVCDVEQSPRRFGKGEDQCGKQNVCVYQYPFFTVLFHNALRLQTRAKKRCFAEKYGVSKTAIKYKINRQYIYRRKHCYDGTIESLQDRSRSPHHHPKAF